MIDKKEKMNHEIFETIKLDEQCEIYISNTISEFALDHSSFLKKGK